MRNASTEFNNIIYGEGNKQYVGKADITLADNTVLPIENADLWQNGIQITEASSNSGSFDIGFCACNQLTLLLNNANGKYSGYDFYDAVVRPQTGLILSGGTEYIKHGVFTVDTPEALGMYISLLCMDNMHKLDKKITSLSGSTAGTMVYDICIKCGVSLKNVNFDGYNKELTIPGNIADYTYRQALSFICRATGNNARFDPDGLLEIYWYDTSVFEQPNLDGGTFDESEYYEKNGESSQVVSSQGKNLLDLTKLAIYVKGSAVLSDVKANSVNIALNVAEVNAYTYVSLTLKGLEIGKTYVVSGKVTGTGIALSNVVAVDVYDPSKVRVQGNVVSFTVQEGYTYYLKLYINATSAPIAGPVTMSYSNLQLELGSVATTYEPFIPNSPSPDYPSPITTNLSAGTYKYISGSDTYEFTITDDLRGIGVVADKVVFDKISNRGYIDRYYGKKVFDGTETWTSAAIINGTILYQTLISASPAGNNEYSQVLSNCFAYVTGLYNVATIGIAGFAASSGFYIRIRVPVSLSSDVASFKAFLAEKYAAGPPVMVQYELVTPTRTELTFTKVSSSSAPEIDASLVTDLSTLPYVYPYTSGDNADGGNFEDYNSGDAYDGGTFDDFSKYHHIYSITTKPTIGTDDIVITGIKVINNDTGASALYGSEEYALVIEDNPFISGRESETAAFVGAKIVGMRFRQFSATARSNPLIQAGDPAYITHKGNTYQGYITRYVFKISQTMEVSCDAESPQKNSSAGLSEKTRVIMTARRVAKQEITTYDLAVQQITNLIAYGYGMYTTEEPQPDGSKKYYMHNKPTIAESSVVWTINSNGLAISTDHGVTWGVDTNGNMLVNVLTAIGINATWINAGEIIGIKITTESGKIGPFTMSAIGLASQYMQFYDDGEYPLLWISKPGTEGGTFDDKADGSARANYEPSVAVVRSIEGDIETDVVMMARTAPDTGKAGTVEIVKTDVVNNSYLSRQRLDDNGYTYVTYDSSGLIDKQVTFNPLSGFLAIDVTNSKSVMAIFDLDAETINLQAAGGVFANGHAILGGG